MSFLVQRLIKCNSGQTLNPLMHLFVFITLAFGVAFILFDHTATVRASVLFMQTANIDGGLNLWGGIAVLTSVLHLIGFIVRGKFGIQIMQFAWFGGIFVWLWAIILYASGGFYFQLIVSAVPNLLFWVWYAWQWRKRHNNEYVAFV